MFNVFKVNSSQQFIDDFSKRIKFLIKNNSRVLWIVSGGSNIETEVEIMNTISLKESAKLEIILSDERFGDKDHPDSNYLKLVSAGFKKKNSNFENILTNNNPKEVARNYCNLFKAKIQKTDYIIAELGIGSDGHIAGVLPNSSAINCNELASYYDGPDFKRLTLTFNALIKINEAFIYSVGREKEKIIKLLQTKLNNPKEFPSQFLYEIKRVSIYNNIRST